MLVIVFTLVQNLPELRAAVANLYNVTYREGKKSLYVNNEWHLSD